MEKADDGQSARAPAGSQHAVLQATRVAGKRWVAAAQAVACRAMSSTSVPTRQISLRVGRVAGRASRPAFGKPLRNPQAVPARQGPAAASRMKSESKPAGSYPRTDVSRASSKILFFTAGRSLPPVPPRTWIWTISTLSLIRRSLIARSRTRACSLGRADCRGVRMTSAPEAATSSAMGVIAGSSEQTRMGS